MSISTKPASGFRDFLPNEMRQRQHVFHIIREVYKAHGFEELDTPCFERLDTLLGKYGDEGDQLMFKVLQRGRKLEKALNLDEPKDTDLADMGLRYDLTVPLARIYAQYKNELPRYFKRYQISKRTLQRVLSMRCRHRRLLLHDLRGRGHQRARHGIEKARLFGCDNSGQSPYAPACVH